MFLQRWHARPSFDYRTTVDYHRSQDTLTTARLAIGVWCWLHGVAALLLFHASTLDSSTATRVTSSVCAVTTIFVGTAWVRGPWPSRFWSLAFIAYAEVGVSAVLLSIGTPLAALPATALLTVIGSYAVVFHGLLVFILHSVSTLALCVTLFIRAVAENPNDLPVASAYGIILGLVIFGTPALIQVLVTLLRRDATTALHDPLTGLRNRRGLDIALEKVLRDPSFASTFTGASLAAAVMDIDKFKLLNDREGHAHGDVVLRIIAERLAATFPSPAITARLGGEEFVVIVSVPPKSSVLYAELDSAVRSIGRHTPVTVSAGLANIPLVAASTAEDVHHLIARADEAMYAAKRAGGNRIFDARAVSWPRM